MSPTHLMTRRKQLPMLYQDERTECGLACIAMIANYWGHQIDLYNLRKLAPVSLQGANFLDLTRQLEQLSFKTRALKVPLSEIKFIKTPAIIHWNMNHFVILKKVEKHSVIIHDPALGVYKYSLEEFSHSFTGLVLEVEKQAEFEQIQAKTQLTLFDLFKTITGVKRFIGLLLFLSLALELFSLANPLFMQYLTDQVIGSSDKANLYAMTIGFGVLLAIHTFTEFLRANMVIFLNNNLSAQFAANVVKHLLKLPLSFFEKRSKGDLQSKFHAVEFIQKKLTTDFITTLLDGFMIVINLLVMFMYSSVLTILVILSLFLYITIRYVSYYNLKKHTEKSVIEHAHASSSFLEILQGIIPIKSFLKERGRFVGWQNNYVKALNAEIKVARLDTRYHLIQQLLYQSEYLVVLCVGAALVVGHQLSLGMLMAFLSYRLSLVNKSINFIHNCFDYKLISIQLNRLSDIVLQQPENLTRGCGKAATAQGHIRLEQLTFSYDDRLKSVFKPVDLTINAGEKIAIVGPSGCGKTTLLKVIMGLLEKSGGEIYIDNIPVKEFGLKTYRELTASVMQEDCLLTGSIMDNIAFFAEEIDYAAVFEAAKIAAIHEEIQRFAMGYETLVGDMGSTLSGGQKQRILLARALYKKPKFLFLDESTSHLDVVNENLINNALKELNITQIIVAHRQETIRMADRVFKLSTP